MHPAETPNWLDRYSWSQSGYQMWGYSPELLPSLLARIIPLWHFLGYEGRSGKAGNNWPQIVFLVCLRISPRGSNFPQVVNSRLSTIDVCFFYPEHLKLFDRVKPRLLYVYSFSVYVFCFISPRLFERKIILSVSLFTFVYLRKRFLKKHYFQQSKVLINRFSHCIFAAWKIRYFSHGLILSNCSNSPITRGV